MVGQGRMQAFPAAPWSTGSVLRWERVSLPVAPRGHPCSLPHRAPAEGLSIHLCTGGWVSVHGAVGRTAPALKKRTRLHEERPLWATGLNCVGGNPLLL